MQFDEVVQRLTEGLRGPLPGAAAHALLAPPTRRRWPDGFDLARVRHAAGLVLVLPIATRPHVVLTLRAETLGRHGGQVSLPGGAVEPGETFEQAALREAQEEVALPAADAQALGLLTPLDIPVSGFRLHPVVAWIDRRPDFKPAHGEVAAVVEVSVEDLLNQQQLTTVERERDGRRIVVPALRAGGFEVWGATAMVLAEFLMLLDWHHQLS
ncbi:MAG TPA: CoA pyrophosphatase [Vicinamibacterales bacterium]|nr:CoA pyrophosphatase [Vicinamibacterales bacterium]